MTRPRTVRRMAFIAAGFAVISGCAAQASQGGQGEWIDLFNGHDLEGWYMIGEGTFYVEDGAIVAETVRRTPTSFLATREHYDDFELLAEFRIDPNINSGIQLRSTVYETESTSRRLTGDLEWQERTWPAGRVYGLQIEIDPSEDGWTGGIYEEGRRGWLAPLNENRAAREAYRPGAWNRLRAIVQGDRIRTWINGVPAVDMEDSESSTGFIALQLHAAGRPEQDSQKTWFRGLRLRRLR